jgi:hypothetical protein
MPTYQSPGVYVEEVPSAVKPIAGVGTSTAGFIGIFCDCQYIEDEEVGTGDQTKKEFAMKESPKENSNWKVKFDNQIYTGVVGTKSRDGILMDAKKKKITFDNAPQSGPILLSYCAILEAGSDFTVKYPEKTETLTARETGQTEFLLQTYPVDTTSGKATDPPSDTALKVKELKNDYPKKGESSAILSKELATGQPFKITYTPCFQPVPANEVKLCTSFDEFKKSFGDFSLCTCHNNLVHAVYGFFNNGGTRCYAVWNEGNIDEAVKKFETIDEIALVAVPGQTDGAIRTAVLAHCEKLGDRFAILDSAEGISGNLTKENINPPPNSTYGAFYFPRIQVHDPVSGQNNLVPPSGHIAGIYARVDAQRGVHKAPANEIIRGALGVEKRLSKADQDGLNPSGINVIRQFNGNITVWGARTLADNAHAEWKYINVRRLFLFLRESIEEGTQWVVFEPNDPGLWAKITRNVTAFLTNVWRAGALFGGTPEQAFYVKCDAETNPPEVRDLGQVVTEIGVAVVKPAEFVIFRISQWAGPGG